MRHCTTEVKGVQTWHANYLENSPFTRKDKHDARNKNINSFTLSSILRRAWFTACKAQSNHLFPYFFGPWVYLGCQTSYLKFSPGFSPTVHCTFPPSISIHCALPWKLFLEISSEIRKIFNIFSKQILCVFTSPKSKYRWHWIWNATFECFQESGIEPADFRLLKGFPFCHVSFNSSSRWGVQLIPK